MAAFTQAEADAVLTRALDLSGVARERYLNESCGRQTPLRALIERLLEASESDEMLLRPGGGAGGPLWDELARQYGGAFLLEPGDRLGAWRIVRTLGRGGSEKDALTERARRALHAAKGAAAASSSDANPIEGSRASLERGPASSLS